MVTPSSDRPTLSFGTYELDLQVGVLRKGGIRLRCQEQPLQVLAVLAERPGELVTREELRRRVWPQDTFVDFDHALNTAVKKIRATLNDDADAPRYIETVPRRGYRFVAQVERLALASPALTPSVQGNLSQPDRRRSLTMIGGVTILVLAFLGFAWRVAPWHLTASSVPPEFQRLTFDLPELADARFTPDGASVVYSAGGHSLKRDIYAQRLGAPNSQSLGMSNSELLAVSRQGELAVLDAVSEPSFDKALCANAGTLARVPLGGGAPRELLSEVEAADWSPDGQLAVVRRVGHKSLLEFPIGKVLYESTGWIASPRFSPAGASIAFLDHPVVPDDRGTVVLVDLKGGIKTLSGFWESERGLAWSPRGDEVWFAAARSGISRTLYAVNLSGRERPILNVAGGLSLQDISRDGRILLERDNERLGILFMGAGEKEPRELSWKDWSIAMDISPDGKQVLFGEEGENSGFSYQVGLRPTDGSPPVILGPGTAQSLSPDGRWALSIIPAPNDQIVLLPTGAGTPKTLERGAIEHYQFAGARWFPDSKQIVFVGSESSHGQRCYVQSIDAGKPRAFTPDGMAFCSVSPDGRILALTDNGRALLYTSESSGKPEKEFNLEPGELPSGWTQDGKFLYVSQARHGPMTLTRLELASGHRQLWKQLPVPPENTIMKSESVLVTPDGQSYAYTYSRHLSDLYVVQGLK
jgi:DNA-binding winged helix-turn-helix (wHTH) protein/Tol biopolymer transport system component